MQEGAVPLPHYAVVDLLAHFVRAAEIPVENEVTVGDSKKPADLLANTWIRGSPLATDMTVTHTWSRPSACCWRQPRKPSRERPS